MNIKKHILHIILIIILSVSILPIGSISAEASEDGTISVCSDENLEVYFIRTLDLETGSDQYVFQFENKNSSVKYFAMIDNLLVNETLFLSDPGIGATLEPGTSYEEIADKLMKTTAFAGVTSIRELSGELTYYIPGENNDITLNFDISLPDTDTGVVVKSYLDAKAGTQVLKEDEYVKITLESLGTSKYGSSYGQLQGILCFENKSTMKLPVGISLLNINGHSVDPMCNSKTLLPRKTFYMDFSCSDSALEEEGIDSIEQVSLLIYSHPAELTGFLNYDGGVWYDIALDSKGTSFESEIEGELLGTVGDVSVYIGEKTMEDYESSFHEDADTEFTWPVTIVNNSNTDYNLSLTDETLNGEAIDSDNDDCPYLFSYTETGAHTINRTKINVYANKADFQMLEGKLQLLSLGKGSILATGTENIILN